MTKPLRDKPFTLMLSASEHAMLMRHAARCTLKTGKRVSAGDAMRELAFGDQRVTTVETETTPEPA